MYHSLSISAGNLRRVGYNLADHVGGGGVPNIGGGARLPMSTLRVYQDDLPLDAEVNVDALEYERIMRRIFNRGGEPDAEVSAFNSSI
jgi:hypothetical protein